MTFGSLSCSSHRKHGDTEPEKGSPSETMVKDHKERPDTDTYILTYIVIEIFYVYSRIIFIGKMYGIKVVERCNHIYVTKSFPDDNRKFVLLRINTRDVTHNTLRTTVRKMGDTRSS